MRCACLIIDDENSITFAQLKNETKTPGREKTQQESLLEVANEKNDKLKETIDKV